MAEFKVGDEVKIIGSHPNAGCITRIREWSGNLPGVKWAVEDNNPNYPLKNSFSDLVQESEIELTKKVTLSMSLIDKFNELSTAEPLKSFVKYGVKTREGKLTEEGTELLLNILAGQKENEAELVKVTDALAAKDKADKKA